MRIVGGRLRGRSLAGPHSHDIRPTSDRLRGSLFDILAHVYGEPNETTRALDVFAGVGGLGLEALSRGAAFALFVDRGAEAQALIRANIDKLGLRAISGVLRADATRLARAPSGPPFSLAFLDPPYGGDLAPPALDALARGGWLAPGALVVVEEDRKVDLALSADFAPLDARVYGDTRISFLRYADVATA